MLVLEGKGEVGIEENLACCRYVTFQSDGVNGHCTIHSSYPYL